MRVLQTLTLLVSLTAAQLQQPLVSGASKAERRPNILFVLTDDQDLHMNSLDYMPFTRKRLVEKGTLFKRHYCTIALCCPSRVSLWTGKAAHNTNVTDVSPPYGGYPKFVERGYNDDWLPLWIQSEGYNTYYVGKLFNAHTTSNYDKPHVSGFNGSDFLLDPYTYQYLNSSFQRNHDPPKYYPGEYSTDILAQKANGFLDDAVEADKPFFLVVAPNAPHSNVYVDNSLSVDDKSIRFGAPVAAERHKHLFKNLKVPRTANFNPNEPSGVNWVAELPIQSEENIAYNDHFFRQRLRALQAVDELVDGLFERLQKYDLLDNTYIFYSSDNGFTIGQHRRQPGKESGFEEDINIPLLVRGPGVAEGKISSIPTTHTDLAPTFLSLIGASLDHELDGTPIPIHNDELVSASEEKNWHEHVNVEYWGIAISEGRYGGNYPHFNNTYKALRVIGNGYNLYYSVWCNDEHELYDLKSDPHEIDNLLATSKHRQESGLARKILGLPIAKVVSRLDSLLFVLKSCKGDVCRDPWKALHPQGDVHTLREALNGKYDSFYEEEQVRIKYNRCEQGYIIDAEGPQFELDGLVYREGNKWSDWV
ncbi:uncharacterized protein PV09_08719 [Verruconis gallopava]|uniref:Arylsulfatase n=1 Tax=Verruconis gallopava TaxID=253628 RepID=A0A0D2A030_9PEZI|nr:uncharacterized protein PV09_08719 [Verruconis gallopava]KIV99664.1 hypothetical protein PV09_08719 [Verruconis gallopava]